jgi:BirA family biotin operon repressor/biotin-[acetyl-CoA-carboxylase] ligase
MYIGFIEREMGMKIGQRIIRVESCSSTNDLAHEMALQGEEEGTVIIAEEQLKGRGTKGRKWYSTRGKGIYFSVILRPRKRNLSLLPLAMGLAVRDALLETAGIAVRLKWPNDLVYAGRKLGGILCEASFRGNDVGHVVLGIGLNLTHARDEFPEEFRNRATSLQLELDKEIDKEDLLLKLWRVLGEWYSLFLQEKEAQIVKIFEESSVFSAGEEIIVQTGKKRIAGKYMGIDLRGRLLLHAPKGEQSFLAAEVIEIKK